MASEGGVQRLLDERLGTTGHENCYFPLFIPLCYFETGVEHVDGFVKDMASGCDCDRCSVMLRSPARLCYDCCALQRGVTE